MARLTDLLLRNAQCVRAVPRQTRGGLSGGWGI